jgi:hypothetical protein
MKDSQAGSASCAGTQEAADHAAAGTSLEGKGLGGECVCVLQAYLCVGRTGG